jgi:DNA polymerase III delta subunit
MTAADLISGKIDLRKLKPGYFFFGREAYPAEVFLDRLRAALESEPGGGLETARFYLDESGWSEILDAARTASLFGGGRRLVVAVIPELKVKRKPAATAAGGAKNGAASAEPEPDEGAEEVKYLDAAGRQEIEAYFTDPPQGTTLVVLRPGPYDRGDSIVRFFSAFPQSLVESVELKPLREKEAARWARETALRLGKELGEAGAAAMVGTVGADMKRLRNEVEKLAEFVGERKTITEEDVETVVSWLKSFEFYAFEDALLVGGYGDALTVMNRMLDEGERPEALVGKLAAFFGRLLLAAAWLREKSRTRDEIFQEFNPRISPLWHDIYRPKFNAFFGRLNGLGEAGLKRLVGRLREADSLIKTTEAEPRTVLEVFLREYYGSLKA